MTDTPRGIRNNNPGNIRHSKVVWEGQAALQPDPDFVAFVSAPYGIRAIAVTLTTYQQDDDCHTIAQLINRWAPPVENDTNAYIDAVAGACGCGATDPVDVRDPVVARDLVQAIIQHENGQQPYSSFTIQQGLALAGIRGVQA